MTYDKIVVPEPICGPYYVSVFGGGSFFGDYDARGDFQNSTNNQPFAGQERLGFNQGWILGGAVGFRTATDWRFEVEVSHNQAAADGVQGSVDPVGNTIFNAPGADTGGLLGDVETTSVYLNVFKEFAGLGFWGVSPYLGAGIGLSNVQADLVSRYDNTVFSNNQGNDGVWNGEGDEVVFSYQFMAGLVFDLTECLEGYLEYRLGQTGDLEDYQFFNDNGGAPMQLNGELELEWTQHVILGLRYYF